MAQVFPSLRILDRARAQLAYLRLPGFGEPPGTGFESLAPGFETYDAFLAARYEAEGFLVNTTNADIAAEAVKRIRRDPSHCLKPVFLLHEAGPLAADLADGQARSVDEAESLLAEFRRDAGPVAELPQPGGAADAAQERAGLAQALAGRPFARSRIGPGGTDPLGQRGPRAAPGASFDPAAFVCAGGRDVR